MYGSPTEQAYIFLFTSEINGDSVCRESPYNIMIFLIRIHNIFPIENLG